MKKKIGYWFYLLLVSLWMSGCIPSQTELSCKAPDIPKGEPSELIVNIYVDGTPSMKGFSQYSTGRYAKTIEALRTMFTLDEPVTLEGEAGSLGPIRYFRLGKDNGNKKIHAISETQYRQAQSSEFYGSSLFPTLQVTHLEAAMLPPQQEEENRMIVVVTDLYQDSDNIKDVTKQLKALMSNGPDDTVGLVGIRSDFSGKIYTEGFLDQDVFKYEGSHPLYVIFVGKLDEVHFYVSKLLEKLGSDADTKPVIFSSNRFYKEPLTFKRKSLEDANPEIRRSVKIPVQAMKDGSMTVVLEDESVQPFLFSRRSPESVSIPTMVALEPIPYVLPLNNIDTTIEVQSSQTSTRTFEPNQGVNILNLVNTSIDEKSLNFDAQFDLSDVARSDLHFLEVDIKAESNNGLEMQSWWSEWNALPSEKDGTKTHNLEEFMLQLRDITHTRLRQKPQVIGKFCYLIQKR